MEVLAGRKDSVRANEPTSLEDERIKSREKDQPERPQKQPARPQATATDSWPRTEQPPRERRLETHLCGYSTVVGEGCALLREPRGSPAQARRTGLLARHF